jgi:hypothetical protein
MPAISRIAAALATMRDLIITSSSVRPVVVAQAV